MTEVRRLLIVALGLTTAAVLHSSSRGAPDTDSGAQPVLQAAQKTNNGTNDGTVIPQEYFAKHKVLVYQPTKGDLHFAIQIQPKIDKSPDRPRDVLVMISTSATQAGASWIASHQLTHALIKNARDGDRISIWTVGTPEKSATRCLTRTFVDGKTDLDKLNTAIEELKKCTPMGVTDLKTAMHRAVESFDGQLSRNRVVLFLGDGLSTHNPMSPADRDELCKKMVERRIAFFALPMGIQMEPKNIHGFATGTGGKVLRARLEEDKVSAVLSKFEEAFDNPILYPTEWQMPQEVSEHYPTELPPVRTDRPTLVIGKIKAGEHLAFTYKLAGSVSGQAKTFRTTETEPMPKAQLDNYFLISMYHQWKFAKNQPALIRADRALAFASTQTALQLKELRLGGITAMQNRELAVAGRLFKQALQIAPHDAEAKAGLQLVANLESGKLTFLQLQKEMATAITRDKLEKINGVFRLKKNTLIKMAQVNPKGQVKNPGGLDGKDLLKPHNDLRKLEEQKVTLGVHADIKHARKILGDDPDDAIGLLRDRLAQVRDHPNLSENLRDALIARLQTSVRELALRGKVIAQRQAQKQDLIAQIKDNIAREHQRTTMQDRIGAQYRVFKNLIAVARMEEKTKQDVLEGLRSMQVEARLKGVPLPKVTQALYAEVLAGYNLRKYYQLKILREKQVLAVLLEIEKSHIPYPDEPGIFFPPLAMWKAITDLRKEKYEVSSLPDDYKARIEAKGVYKLLEEKFEIKDFQQPMNLQFALGLIYDKISAKGKDVPILIDKKAFKRENPAIGNVYETEVDLKDIPPQTKLALGTILRLMLSQIEGVDATYLIRRTFIEITTVTAQTKDRVLRVYPVGQLVIPISQQLGGFGVLGGGGGGFGQLGGGFGQLGGGFGQLGGGFGQLGGGFGQLGGGFGQLGGGFGQLGGGFGQLGGGFGQLGGGFGQLGGGFGQLGGGFGQLGGGFGQLGGGFGQGGGIGFQGQFGGGNFVGGTFQGGFNGGLGMLGASQAQDLIMTITRVVAPGSWFYTQQPAPGLGGVLGGGFGALGGGFGVLGGQLGALGGQLGALGGQLGALGGGQLGALGGGNLGNLGGGAPPPPVAQGGPADIRDANTIEFFPSALALIIRAPSRVHYTQLGGVIGGKSDVVGEDPLGGFGAAMGRGLEVIAGGPNLKKPGANVAGVKDKLDPKNKVEIVKNKIEKEKLDPAKVWQEALSKGGIPPGLVIASVDFLFEAREYKHAAELLKANLRLGITVRPWVYEALAVALEASGGAPDEIRQARLSAVALNPRDAGGYLTAAQEMAKQKEYDRALAFCKQAASLSPDIPQPYAQALAYAEMGKDSEAMRWAINNILAKDWPVNNRKLHLRAQAKGESLATTLSTGNRKKEADAIRKALETLTRRDLIIHLSWANSRAPADLDLQVKEPVGSVCSIKQRQTPGGGILLGNTLVQNDKASYMVSTGFSGEYTVTVQRNWGMPIGGRARLEVIMHQGTPQEVRKLYTIRLEQPKTIKIDLNNGRRTELAIVPPAGVHKAVPQTQEQQSKQKSVYRKLRELADPDYAGATGGGGMSAGVGTPGAGTPTSTQKPVLRKQPEHTTFQTGVRPALGSLGLQAQAKITADRQFLRLSMTPVFQTVTQNSQFPSVNLPLIPGGRP